MTRTSKLAETKQKLKEALEGYIKAKEQVAKASQVNFSQEERFEQIRNFKSKFRCQSTFKSNSQDLEDYRDGFSILSALFAVRFVREKSSEDVQVELYMEDDGYYSKIADFNVCWLPDLIKCLSEAKKFLKERYKNAILCFSK